MSDLEFLKVVLVKIIYATICGAIVGFEREKHRAPAGFKTQILICLGSALFAIAGNYVALGDHADASRIIAQIITGVGFLGAGAIIHNRSNHVIGLTTAAWIWFTSAVGILCALGFGLAATAITVFVVIIVYIAGRFESSYINREGSKDEIGTEPLK